MVDAGVGRDAAGDLFDRLQGREKRRFVSTPDGSSAGGTQTVPAWSASCVNPKVMTVVTFDS